MNRSPLVESFWLKAVEQLAGAESEYDNHRYNTSVKLAYYACFQATVAALVSDGLSLPQGGGTWSHAVVQAEFARRLIAQRKRYSASLRDTLPRLHEVRQIADYTGESVSEGTARRALRRAREFVAAVQVQLEGQERR